MDSMRSLNTSLPRTSPPKQPVGEPPEPLLHAFRAAALSVTTLYKTAAQNQSKARADGYQDALDELLAFLDKEDIGLSDGEGWRIRRWATERLDGRESVSHAESEDENPMEKADRASSPILQRSQSATRLSPNPRNARSGSPSRPETVMPTSTIPPPMSDPTPPAPIQPLVMPQQNFSFRASHPYPQDADSIVADLEMSDGSRTSSHEGSAHSTNPGITITRPSRTTTRHNTHSARLGSRTSTAIGTIGKGAGQKRKINMHEFFDIGNVTKDGFGGGGKRGRFI